MCRWRRYCWWCPLCFYSVTVPVTWSVLTCSSCRSCTPTTNPVIASSLLRTCFSICSTPTSPPTFSCTTRPGGRFAMRWCVAVDAAFGGWRLAAVSADGHRMSTAHSPPATVQFTCQTCRWEGLHMLLAARTIESGNRDLHVSEYLPKDPSILYGRLR